VRILRNILLTPLVLWALVGPVAAHRAYYQVQSVDIEAIASPLRAGSIVRASIVSSGRVEAALVLELAQGNHREVLSDVTIRANVWRYWDPRRVHGSTTVTLEGERLSRFRDGPAVIRAIGHGNPQWLRVPPPVRTEARVDIRR
jgi:hypothetical protein